jgi:hypothetical protein
LKSFIKHYLLVLGLKKSMLSNPFTPHTLIGRGIQLDQVKQILAQDGDLLVAGVPGSGRHTVIRAAAQQVGAKVLEIDCLRATNAQRLLELLAEGLLNVFTTPTELGLIQRWSTEQPLVLEQAGGRSRLVWHFSAGSEWTLLQALLTLPQKMAEWLNCRVILVFQNFPHIQSWDRGGKWESYLRQEIQQHSRVSYALIATVPQPWVDDSSLQVITLGPLENHELQPWISNSMATEGLKFEPDAQTLFLHYVQGHLGEAIALARRIWLDCRPFGCMEILAHQVHRSTLLLVEDLSLTFESLILLLPPSQVRVLESLALDPTDSPHSQEYIRKHQLSRGGSLQGALASLEQKGLMYGPEYGYRIALPLLAFWLKHRLA